MGGFQTHISKCSERGVKLNFLIFFSKGHPQQKGLQGQEFSGMGASRFKGLNWDSRAAILVIRITAAAILKYPDEDTQCHAYLRTWLDGSRIVRLLCNLQDAMKK